MNSAKEQRASITDLLTPPELANRLRLKTSWVYSHADTLGVIRLGKYLRFDWNTVIQRLASADGDTKVLGSHPNDQEKA